MAFGAASVLTNAGKAITANRIKGTGTEPSFIAVGSGATGADRTASATDTSLTTQYSNRVVGTSSVVTTAVTNDTYQVVGTIAATGTVAVDEAGLFDATTAGNMYFSATFPVINLASGDSIQAMLKVQYS